MLNKLNKILLKLIFPDDTCEWDSHHTQEWGELYETGARAVSGFQLGARGGVKLQLEYMVGECLNNPFIYLITI